MVCHLIGLSTNYFLMATAANFHKPGDLNNIYSLTVLKLKVKKSVWGSGANLRMQEGLAPLGGCLY